MRRKNLLAFTLCLLGLLAGLGTMETRPGASTPGAGEPQRSFIVQGRDSQAVGRAVRGAGGELTHRLDIIHAAGAELTAAQRKELTTHPDTGAPVKVGIGRYGPYVVHEGDYRSLKKTDDVLSITGERALELLAEPKRGRGGRPAAKPIRELGPHPDDGDSVNVFEGRYGPYVKHGRINASLPKGMEIEAVDLAAALELLAAKKAKGGKRGATAKRKPSAKKASGKKPS